MISCESAVAGFSTLGSILGCLGLLSFLQRPRDGSSCGEVGWARRFWRCPEYGWLPSALLLPQVEHQLPVRHQPQAQRQYAADHAPHAMQAFGKVVDGAERLQQVVTGGVAGVGRDAVVGVLAEDGPAQAGVAGGLVLLLRIPRGPGRPVAATSRPAGPHPKGLHLEQVRAEMAT